MKIKLRIVIIDAITFGTIGYILPPMNSNELFVLGLLLLAIKLNNYFNGRKK